MIAIINPPLDISINRNINDPYGLYWRTQGTFRYALLSPEQISTFRELGFELHQQDQRTYVIDRMQCSKG